jgi:Zn-dependent protease
VAEQPASGTPPATALSATPAHQHAGAGARRLGPLAGAAAVLAKTGGALLKLKALASVGTMLLSVLAYTLLYGWRFAVGLVALIAVHELGHVAALRRRGIAAGLPVFLPFLGAFVNVRQAPRSVYVEAETALAGPAAGVLGAAAVAAAASLTGSDLLRALAFTGFLINLFNLLPALPLDGGRAAGALHPAVWGAGLAALLVIEVLRPSPVVLLVLVLGGLEAFRRWRGRRTAASRAYHALTAQERLLVASGYLGLVVVTAAATALAYVPRSL